MNATVPTIHFDAAVFPGDERFERWRATTSAYQVRQKEGTGVFSAVADAWMLDDLLVAHTRMSGAHFERPAEMVKADGVDRYAFILLKQGTWTGEAEGRLLTAGSGQVVGFDFTRPLYAAGGDGDTITISIARRAFDAVVPSTLNLHGTVLGGTMGRLVAAHLLSLVDELPDMKLCDAPAAAKATIGLIASCFATATEMREPAALSAVRHRVRRFIDLNLTADDLTPDRICRELNLSRSTLYRALRPSGVAAYVRTRRLEATHVLFNDPTEARGIATIAYNFGFVSEAHFSRAFRAQFGCSPRQARNGAVHLASIQAAPHNGDAADTFRHWMKSIS